MYTLLSLVILCISYFLFRRVAGSLRLTQLNMISWIFFYNLLLQSFIASILIVNNIDQHYMVGEITGQYTRFYGWLAVQYTMLTMPIGMLFAVHLAGYRHNRGLFSRYIHGDLKPLLSKHDSYIRYPLYLLSALSIVCVFYVMVTLKSIPLLSVLQGLDSESLSFLRQEASRGFKGNIYVKNILALLLTPILSYIAYSYYWLTKRTRDLTWFILLFASSLLILTYSIEKAPVVEYLLGFMFLFVLTNGGIKKEFLLTIACAIIGLLVVMYVFIGGVTDPSVLFSYNSGMVGRILLSQSAGTYLSFDVFPDSVTHLGFSSVSNKLSSLTGLEHGERSARILMETYRPIKVAEGSAGVMNSLFIAEAWANFNLRGILLAPFYVGVVIQCLFLFFLRMPKTPLLLGPFAYFSYKSCVTGGFNDYFYNAGNIILVIIFSTVIGLGLLLRASHQSNITVPQALPTITESK